MATAKVQQVVTAVVVHDSNSCLKEEESHEVQDMPSAEVEEAPPREEVHGNGGEPSEEEERKEDKEDIAVDTVAGVQGIEQEVEAKLAVQVQQHHQGKERPAVAEAKEPGEERLRGAKKAGKAVAKWAVVPVDDETDDEVATAAEAPVAPAEAVATGEEAAKGDQVLQDEKKKVHEE